jgi:hypothetical protein
MPLPGGPRFISDLFDLGIWREKSGLETPIEDMKTTHIQACLGMIKHHPKLWRQRYIPLLEAELNKRGIKPYGQG